MSKTSSYWTISDSTLVTTESCENKRAALNAYPWDGSLREVTGPMLQLNNNKFLGYNRPECPTPVVRMDLFGLVRLRYRIRYSGLVCCLSLVRLIYAQTTNTFLSTE